MKSFREASIIALVVWRVALWYGILPCSHSCYWCGQ